MTGQWVKNQGQWLISHKRWFYYGTYTLNCSKSASSFPVLLNCRIFALLSLRDNWEQCEQQCHWEDDEQRTLSVAGHIFIYNWTGHQTRHEKTIYRATERAMTNTRPRMKSSCRVASTGVVIQGPFSFLASYFWKIDENAQTSLDHRTVGCANLAKN